MKKYGAIFVFIVSITIIVFYIFRNIAIGEKLKQYTEVQQLTYQIEILLQEKRIITIAQDHDLSDAKNLSVGQELEERFVFYKESTYSLKDKKLSRIVSSIDKKRLANTYAYNYTLENNHFIQDLDRVILHTLKKLHILQGEREAIIRILLIVSIFLIVFALYMYFRDFIATNEIKKVKNNLEHFFNALNESAIVSKTDYDGNISYINDKFCEISGYAREELIGKNHSIVRNYEMDDDFYEEMWSVIKNKEIFRGTIVNQTKEGEEYLVESIIMPLENVEGEVTEFISISHDITELIQSKNKALRAEKVKTDFLANMSHELRTPLNSISGFSAMLQRQVKIKKQLIYINNIVDSSAQLLGLINDILDLSKLQTSKFTLDYQDFNLIGKVEMLVASFETQIKNAEVSIKLNIDASTNISLHGDWVRISQMITNLISNAIKFSSEDTQIEVSTLYKDANLIIAVKDEGIGMSKSAQERVFKPFEQADTSTTRKYGGTGLGLNIVLNLVKQMGGDVKLQSQEGVGSTFTVTIPLEVAQNQDTEENEVHEVSFTSLDGYVLIAEDNKTNQKLISFFMQEYGLRYKLVNDGLEAVEAFKHEKFDLILMDENMPNLNGTEALAKIHLLYGRDVPCIALTANAMAGDKERFLDAGMDAYVSKPIDSEVLYKTMSRLLEKSKK